MRSTWFGLSLLVVAATASGDTVARLVDRASDVNGAYQISVAEYELAMLRYESDLETAKTADEKVSAELRRLSAFSSHQNSLKSYYNEVIDAVFDMGIAIIDLQAAEISGGIAEIDLAYARARYDNGLISASDLTNAELSYREEQNSFSQEKFDEQEARNDLRLVTGLAWDSTLLPGEPGSPANADVQLWVEADTSCRQALLNESQAEREAENPAGTVSDYDQMVAEIELETARLNTRQTRESAEREYRRTLRTIESNRITLEIQGERLALQQQLLIDANVRLDRGLITPSDRDQQEIRVLNAHVSYLESVRRSIKNLVNYLVHLGEPIDIL